MAFESLSDKLSLIFKKIKGQARLTENNMEDMLKEIRVALLEADVNYKVVKEFTNNIREKAVGQEVLFKLIETTKGLQAQEVQSLQLTTV